MSKKLIQLTIVVSGTTDTDSEKAALRPVVEDLNKLLEKPHGITLRVRSWPDDVRPGVNTDPQAEVSRQLGSEYDIYVGLLGSRFGTPTPRFGSGTEEEFEEALKRFKEDSQSVRLLFYFKQSIENAFSLDLDGLQKVTNFRDSLPRRGILYRDFTDTAAFVQLVREHLYNMILEELKDGTWIAPAAAVELPHATVPTRDDAGRRSVASDRTARLGASHDLPGVDSQEPEAVSVFSTADDEFGFLDYLDPV